LITTLESFINKNESVLKHSDPLIVTINDLIEVYLVDDISDPDDPEDPENSTLTKSLQSIKEIILNS
jgi:hypothetical protein